MSAVTVVVCDGHKSPLPVMRFVRDGDVWRCADGSSVVVHHHFKIKCPWCKDTLTLRGKRLAVVLSRRATVSMRELAAMPTARRKSPRSA